MYYSSFEANNNNNNNMSFNNNNKINKSNNNINTNRNNFDTNSNFSINNNNSLSLDGDDIYLSDALSLNNMSAHSGGLSSDSAWLPNFLRDL